jgi:hypothetical protein
MSNPLVLNQPQVGVGLQTYTITIPAAGQYNAQAQIIVPQALATGSGAGSNKGLGNGAGGGGEGFVRGDFGLGFGGVGQGFGAGNGYQQPSINVTTNPLGPIVATGLALTVVNTTTSTTILTMTSFSPSQDFQKFKVLFQAALNDVITVTYSSSTASDNALNGLVSTTTIAQGFN